MGPSPTADDLAALVDAELREIFAPRKIPLYDMMSYQLGWTGDSGSPPVADARKRAHGVLCLMANQAAGGDANDALPTAAAVELVDNFCQIHDDVQGGIPQRNKRDAVWWVWGPAQAINAGDGMHALARLALFRLLKRGVSAETTFRGVEILDQASLKLCEGRFVALEAQERLDMSVDAYLKMASDKSGALVSCAMRLGGMVATDDQQVMNALGECGASIGVAMQVHADLRELWTADGSDGPASPEVLNKTKLLPVVWSLEKAGVTEKRRLGEIYFKRVLEPGDVDTVREVAVQLGARDFCESLIGRYRKEISDALDSHGISADGAAAICAFVDGRLDS